MYKKITLLFSFAIASSCCAMEPISRDSFMRRYRKKLEHLNIKLRHVERSLASLPTEQPNIQPIVQRTCVIARAQIIAQAQSAHYNVAPVSVAMAREFTKIITRTKNLNIE
jgi:hypothetical protein